MAKQLAVVASSLISVSALTSRQSSATEAGNCESSPTSFVKYVQQFGRDYAVGSKEYADREAIFNERALHSWRHNCDSERPWKAGINHLSDWTDAELQGLLGHKPAKRQQTAALPNGFMLASIRSPRSRTTFPDEFSWGNLTSVQETWDQGNCGSCWAVAATAVMRAHAEIKGLAREFSTSQVVACTPNPDACGGTGGCNGATAELAFNYTSRVGLSLEVDYPYHIGAKCSPNALKPNVTNDGFVKLQPNNYSELIGAVATKGPIAIAVAAGSIGWQNYGGGVFGKASGTCGFVHDHAVQLVGYGSDKGNMYWLVRNSWGADWGEKGYVRIRRYGENEPCGVDKYPLEGEACKGDNKPRTYCGVCGILGSSSYPTGVRRVPRFLV